MDFKQQKGFLKDILQWMRMKVLWNCKKSLWRGKDSNSLVLRASARNSWQTFHFMPLFLLVGLGWVPAVIREGPEIFEILEEVKCKFNRYLSSLEFLVSRLISIYQDQERKRNDSVCFLCCFFIIIIFDSLKWFRKLLFKKKMEGLRKESFRYYPNSSHTTTALGLSAHEELQIPFSFFLPLPWQNRPNWELHTSNAWSSCHLSMPRLGVKAQSATPLRTIIKQYEMLSPSPCPPMRFSSRQEGLLRAALHRHLSPPLIWGQGNPAAAQLCSTQ